MVTHCGEDRGKGTVRKITTSTDTVCRLLCFPSTLTFSRCLSDPPGDLLKGGNKRFSSAHEFAFHAAWLYDRQYHNHGDCECTLCTHRKQGVINNIFFGHNTRRSPSPDATDDDDDDDEEQSRRRRSVRGHVAVKDSGTAKSVNYEHLVRPLFWVSGSEEERTPSLDRHYDLVTLRPFRPHELVWVSIPDLEPEETTPNGKSLRFWPAVVEDLWRQKSLPVGDKRSRHKEVSYRVRLLGAKLTNFVLVDQIVSWQAYHLPEVVLKDIQDPSMPVEVTSSLSELEFFYPLEVPATTTHSDAFLPNSRRQIPRTYENALGPLALAYRMAKIIERSWFPSDPLPENTSSSRYQGLWWGAERIWVDDIVRLGASREELLKDLTSDSLMELIPVPRIRGLLAHVLRISQSGKGEPVYFFADIYELEDVLDASHTLTRIKPTISLAEESVSAYPLPKLPKGQVADYSYRKLTFKNKPVKLPVRYIAGRYDARSLEKFRAKPQLLAGPGVDLGRLKVLAGLRLSTASAPAESPEESSIRDREVVIMEARLRAREETHSRWSRARGLAGDGDIEMGEIGE